MGRSKDDTIWKKEFSWILKSTFSACNFTYENFADAYGWSSSTVRYWLTGRNLPNRTALTNLKEYFGENLTSDEIQVQQLHEKIKILFQENGLLEIYLSLKRAYPTPSQFLGEILYICYNLAKHNSILRQTTNDMVSPKGTTQVVVFDFDGTLTSGKGDKTTWEILWTQLGYDIRLCKQLHQQYNLNEISHAEWCRLTEKKFCERKLHKDTIYEIASNVHLIHGIKETFQELARKNIKIYIVSGSIKTIIAFALNDLCKYVEEVSANEFCFDNNGYLAKIIGTDFDFEGKALFINKIAAKYEISEKDILFVGNSINDRFAYLSGARTLCINPRLTDPANSTVWNKWISFCDDLTEILEYI